MDEFGKKVVVKKKVTKEKIFQVPFSLGEGDNNINITTHNPLNLSELSKEQLLNQAFKLHSKGNIIETTKYYKKLIDQGCCDHRVFLNYGAILHDLGNLKEAEKFILQSIKIKPNFAEAHSNFGNLLRDLSKLKAAEISIRKAIHIKPNLAEAHYNLGIILRDIGKLKEAEISTRIAIKIKPDAAHMHSNLGLILIDLGDLKEAEESMRLAIDLNSNFVDAKWNLGNILRDLGKSNEALDAYLKAIEFNSKSYNDYSSISRFLRDSDLHKFNKSKLKKVFSILIKKDNITHKDLFKVFNFLYGNLVERILNEFDSNFFEGELVDLFIKDKLIIIVLKKIILTDIRIEKLLTNIRKNICSRIAKNTNSIDNCELNFVISLAHQCFLNEYIYSLNLEEKTSLELIISRCKQGELDESNISILACYYPLSKLLTDIPDLQFFPSSNNCFRELIKLQITEPLEEIKLSKDIQKIGLINDNISLKVQSQYEDNPYPRWQFEYLSNKEKSSGVLSINAEIKPNTIRSDSLSDRIKVLIAGCGTGLQILHAQRYKNAQITAIDLSRSSLAFAQRKINELGINNVNLIQMDLLDLSKLKQKFDIVECCGVLHHMENPQKGLNSLLDIMNPNGFMRLSLYSELSRETIVKAREYIKIKNIQPDIDSIREFRKDIFSGKLSELYSLANSGSDFYTTSNLRDLCFHYQEHRFTFYQLEKILILNKLNFLGFLLPLKIRSLYNSYFPEDKLQTNLKNWGKLERNYPGIFASTPAFWVSKNS